MPALLFQEGWLKKLLDGTKQQTTRGQTDRIKVGDICHLYNQQRRQIADKPTLQMTELGRAVISQKRLIPYDNRTYPPVHNDTWIRGRYYAHFLGKVVVTEVYDMLILQNSHRNAWARADGFSNFTEADSWFTKRYGETWANQLWTVIRWGGWLERYFLAEGEAIR